MCGFESRRPHPAWWLALIALAGCDHHADTGPVRVDVIGATPIRAMAGRVPVGEPARVFTGAVAQGLVRFDAAGQIEPGVAERWTVIDNGMSYIFRLREADWTDGKPVTAIEVAAALRAQLAPATHNPLAPWLSAIGDVVVMTPEVIEVEMRRPRPDLLKLFAQPEMAITRVRLRSGAGPFRIDRRSGRVRLQPAHDPVLDDDAPRPRPEDDVELTGPTAARAILRFITRRSDLVMGGSFVDWPLLAQSGVGTASVRVDPAAGLTGLAIVNRDGFLADPSNRDAISSIFDRRAIATLLGWSGAEQIIPETLDSAAPPLVPGWTVLAVADRRATARARLTAWQVAHAGPVTIRVALPDGPGANLLWGHVGQSLTEIGVVPIRVRADALADLRLVDAVAPYDSARWYLATACQPCGGEALARINAARQAPTLALRAQALAQADQAIAADTPFIPLARPLRWSLVAPRLREWQPNARAWHPLNHLRGVPTS